MSIPQNTQITSPVELSRLLREIKAAVAAGELEQVQPDPAPFATNLEVTQLADDGPWPDYLELRFKELPGGRHFKLSVETYHGAGGTWGVEAG